VTRSQAEDLPTASAVASQPQPPREAVPSVAASGDYRVRTDRELQGVWKGYADTDTDEDVEIEVVVTGDRLFQTGLKNGEAAAYRFRLTGSDKPSGGIDLLVRREGKEVTVPCLYSLSGATLRLAMPKEVGGTRPRDFRHRKTTSVLELQRSEGGGPVPPTTN
jgi:uncharacterized protein (TIGR03067 family)